MNNSLPPPIPSHQYLVPDLKTFFNVHSLHSIKWSHATNTEEKLFTALADYSIMMIEGDICMRDDGEVVMAHPPDRQVNYLFKKWILTIIDYLLGNSSRRIGIKLDFKDPPVVEYCLKMLQDIYASNSDLIVPVWFNADVLRANGLEPAFDPVQFVAQVQSVFSDSLVSLGWTTVFTENVKDNCYKPEMAMEMIEYCRSLQHVNFPLRGSFLRQSETFIRLLVDCNNAYTLTIWTGPESVAEEDLQWILNNFCEKVYLDISN